MTKGNYKLPVGETKWQNWHVPVECGQYTLREVLDSAKDVRDKQEKIPLVVQLVENPKFDFPGIEVFGGAVDLFQHDCIHAILGRGLLPHDEAFTIGFTVGSTNRVKSSSIKLYEFVSKYLYPDPYKFQDDDLDIFNDAIQLGIISDCVPFTQIDFKSMFDLTLVEIRNKIGLEVDFLMAYYRIEQKRYPDHLESKRLLINSP